MAFAAQLRQNIEASLAGRAASARLVLAPRLVAPGFETGYSTLDHILRGGLPVAGTTEILGGRSSGRTSLAMAYLAERTREGHVCAWVDVAGDLLPDAALADGLELDRVLWVRCGGTAEPSSTPAVPLRTASAEPPESGLHLVASAFPEAKPNLRPFNPKRSGKVGTPGASNRPLTAVVEPRAVQVATDRLPSRRGDLVLHKEAEPRPQSSNRTPRKPASTFVKPKKPWTRLEQAIKAVDLLVQAGGFGAIVLDLGTIAPRFARRIPLSTWFRWRAALERGRSSLLVLSQASGESQTGCAGSAAELVLRVEAEVPQAGTVLTSLSYRMEVVRRRFAESTPPRKPPGRAQATASAWQTKAPWVAS